MSTIDTSGIDATKPEHGEATTQSVRDNFSAIKTQLGNAAADIGALEGGSAVTYEVLDTNGDVGTGIGQLAIGNHNHTGTYQPLDAGLTSIAGLTTAADRMIYTTALDTYAVTTLTAFGRSLIDDADAATCRTTLGLGDSATKNVGTGAGTVAAGDHNHAGVYEPADATILKDADIGVTVQGYDVDTAKYDAATANFTGTLQNGGSNVVVDTDIGSTVQAYDAELAALAGLTSAANKVPYFTGSGTAGVLDFLDEDNMASDSATAVPSQQSVKAYVDAAGGGAFEGALLHVQDQKTDGTAGGNASAATENIRTLNTVLINEISGASLSSNRITLPAGTYFIIASAPAQAVDAHHIRLYNVTDTAYFGDIEGTSEQAPSANQQNRSFLTGRFTITGTPSFEIHHYTQSAATNGLGVGNGSGVTNHETYTDVLIWKVA